MNIRLATNEALIRMRWDFISIDSPHFHQTPYLLCWTSTLGSRKVVGIEVYNRTNLGRLSPMDPARRLNPLGFIDTRTLTDIISTDKEM